MAFENIGFTTARVEFHKNAEPGCYTIKRDCLMGCNCEAVLSKAGPPSLEMARKEVLCFNNTKHQGISGNGCSGRTLQEDSDLWVFEIDAKVLKARP